MCDERAQVLPNDPETAAVLEEAIAETFAAALAEEADALANAQATCPDCGQWLRADGSCTSCRGTDGASGENPDSAESQAAEIGKGKAAVRKILETKADIYDETKKGGTR